MKKKKNSLKVPTPNTIAKRVSSYVIFVIIIGAVIGGWFLLTRNDSLYQVDSEQAKREIKAAFFAVNLQGELVYESVQDKGCDSSRIGLAQYTSCGFEGYKIYKNNGDLTQDSRAAETALINYGLKSSLGGYRSGDAGGTKDELSISVHSRPSDYEPGKTDPIIGQLITDGKVTAPIDSEYLYGIYASNLYYSCNHDTYWKPCPTPPSTPK